MKTFISTFLVSCLIFFFACNSNEANQSDSQEIENITSYPENMVVPWVDILEVRAKPIMKSSVLAAIKKNEPLMLTEEVTGFRDTFTLEGKTIIDSWVKVKTKKGRIGWVFRGAVKRPEE